MLNRATRAGRQPNCRVAHLALRFIDDSELSNSLARWLTRLRPWRD